MTTVLCLIGALILICILIVTIYSLIVIWMRFWWLILFGLFCLVLVGIECLWRAILL